MSSPLLLLVLDSPAAQFRSRGIRSIDLNVGAYEKEDAKKRFVSGDELCLRRILGISDNNNNIYLAKEQVNHKGKSPSKLHTKNY